MIDKHHVPVSLARKTPPRPTWYPVVCTQNGRTCGGRFTTDAKGLMVSYGGRLKSPRLGGMPVPILAQALLAEIVSDTSGD